MRLANEDGIVFSQSMNCVPNEHIKTGLYVKHTFYAEVCKGQARLMEKGETPSMVNNEHIVILHEE